MSDNSSGCDMGICCRCGIPIYSSMTIIGGMKYHPSCSVLILGDAQHADDLALLRARLASHEAEIARMAGALKRAHGCATLRDDGTCDGCFVSAALKGE